MATHELLSVKHHQQDTDYYCGAACAQMVLDQIGAGTLDQDDLYNDNHSHSTIETNWYSGPDGVTWTMNNRKPASFGNYFVLFEPMTEDAISRKIAWTIHHYKVAPIALVYGWDHWIVVHGYTADNAPTSSFDTAYALQSFDVNNPWPPTPSGVAEPPHSATDGCGSGGTRGVANENIAIATWRSTYMTGVPGGHWSGKFLAVCDPEPAAERIGRLFQDEPRFDGRRLLDEDTAREAAVEGIKRYGLTERREWRDALNATRAGRAVIVQRLDQRDSYYHIVPFTDDGNRLSVLASTDARFGNYRQAAIVRERTISARYDWAPESLLKLVLSRPLELAEPLGRLKIRPESVCIYPHLVWRPCRESLSPYWPFYMLTVGSQRIYIRVDGAIFTRLTLDQPGI